MKNRFLTVTRKGLFISAMTIFTIGAIQTSAFAQQPTQQPGQTTYSISGDGASAQVYPAIQGTGLGTIKGTFDPSTRELKYTTTWDKLSSAPSTGGFYTGASGTSGKALGEPWTLGTNLTPTGNYTNTVTLDEQQTKDLLGGNLYYSYGTTTNSNGEVRGQISAKPVGQ